MRISPKSRLVVFGALVSSPGMLAMGILHVTHCAAGAWAADGGVATDDVPFRGPLFSFLIALLAVWSVHLSAAGAARFVRRNINGYALARVHQGWFKGLASGRMAPGEGRA